MSKRSQEDEEIDEMFQFAVEQVRNSEEKKNGGPTDDEKLKFYGLYKQATVGPCNIPKPWAVQVVESAKWNAWNGYGKMSKNDAKLKYCELYEKLEKKYKK